MPDYSLKCKICGNKFSFFGSWEKRKLTTCPCCGSDELEQEYKAEGNVGVRQLKNIRECPMSGGVGCPGCSHRN